MEDTCLTPKALPVVSQRQRTDDDNRDTALRLQPVTAGEAGRRELEAYVRARFAAKHGAVIRTFMPTLVSFREPDGELRGVVGIRGATEGRLYLEQYLDRPVEERLAASLPSLTPNGSRMPVVSRDEIVEVGNLAGASWRATVRMIALLPGFLVSRRYSWVVFTATGALRQILEGTGASLIELGRADAAHVASSADSWGRYYETDPHVFAGYLPDAGRLAGVAHRTAGN